MTKSVDEVWCICLDLLRNVMERQHFNMWIRSMNPIELNENVLVVLLPGQIFYDHIDKHFAGLLNEALQQLIGEDARIEYRIKAESITADYKSKQSPVLAPASETLKTDHALNPDFVLETFITGKNNIHARLAAADVAKYPGDVACNPLVIYGKPGLGKAHLGHAIGNEIKRINPQLKVLQVGACEFIRQFEEYDRNCNSQDFILFYQSLDVLIVNDIQFLAESSGSQDAFLGIFNHLHRSAKQMIFTSDKAPQDLKGLQIKLWSRLQWGRNTEITLPDYDTRLRIIQNKIKSRSLEISDEVISYLATNVTGTVRDLEGALTTLLVRASLAGRN